jgi:hypothetical protein
MRGHIQTPTTRVAEGTGSRLTETSPLAELLAVVNLDQGDVVLRAQGDDQLLVRLLLAALVQDAHVGLASVEGLGSLAQTAGKTVVHEGELQNTLEGILNGHLALGGIGGNLNLLRGLGGVVLFYVRLRGSAGLHDGQWQVGELWAHHSRPPREGP